MSQPKPKTTPATPLSRIDAYRAKLRERANAQRRQREGWAHLVAEAIDRIERELGEILDS